LGVDERRQLRQQSPPDGCHITLALQHAGKPGKIRLKPVLFGVAVCGEPQVVNHRVDVVFEFGYLAAGLDLDGASQVTLCHRSGHLSDSRTDESSYLPAD
jgi:hypothetical protein